MARITGVFLSLAHLSLAVVQSYTSLKDMPAWKTLPPDVSTAVTEAASTEYAGCVTSVPENSTAACFATLTDMASSFLTNIVSGFDWNSGVPTQFQASATSVAKDWYGQPVVKAAISVQTSTPTSSSLAASSKSGASTSTAAPGPNPRKLNTTALIFEILGPIIGIAGIIVAIILYRKGKLPFQRRTTVGTQSHRSWPPDRPNDHQEGAMNTMNNHQGGGHFLPTTNSGSRNRTTNAIGDGVNFHIYAGGETRRDGTPLQQYPRRPVPAHTTGSSSEGSASSNWTPLPFSGSPGQRLLDQPQDAQP